MGDAKLAMLERAANQLLAVVAPTASRLVYTQVVMKDDHDTASTDGASVIYMPADFCGQPIPANEPVSVGLLAHEVGHFLQPLDAIRQVEAEGAPHWLANVLLDIQGEAMVESIFPALRDPLAEVRRCVKQTQERTYVRKAAAAASLSEAFGPLVLLARFASPSQVFDARAALDHVHQGFAQRAAVFLNLMAAAELLPPDGVASHLRTILHEFPELRGAPAPNLPLGAPASRLDGALGGLLAGEIRTNLTGWSGSREQEIREKQYAAEPPRPEAVRLSRAIRARFDVRFGKLEVVAPGRFDRHEAARGNLPFRMGVKGQERPLPRALVCVDVSSSMDEQRKHAAAFIAAQALALAVQASGGEAVGLLFDSYATVSVTGDASPLFAPRSQWRNVDGTSFLFLSEAWRRWPRHRVLLVTDGLGNAPTALPSDRARTVGIVIPPGKVGPLLGVCVRVVTLDRPDLLPSILAMLLPRTDVA